MGGRADLHGAAGRPVHLLRGQGPPPVARAVEDAALKEQIRRVYTEQFAVYGAEKVWRQLGREGAAVGRDRVARLMRELGLGGATRAKTTRTTRPAAREPALPADLVRRDFTAAQPNRLWVNDLTYVPLVGTGFAYTAFVVDACSRRIVGWQVAASLQVDLALDALEMAIWARRDDPLGGLVHHSDRGGQYLALRYTARLEAAGIVPSVGSKGDSSDNALAETVNGLSKAELIRRHGPWRTVAAVAVATAAWVAWWNTHRLHGALGHVPPADYEAAHQPAAAAVAERGRNVRKRGCRTMPNANVPAGSGPRRAGWPDPGPPCYRGRRNTPANDARMAPRTRLNAPAPSGRVSTKVRAVQDAGLGGAALPAHGGRAGGAGRALRPGHGQRLPGRPAGRAQGVLAPGAPERGGPAAGLRPGARAGRAAAPGAGAGPRRAAGPAGHLRRPGPADRRARRGAAGRCSTAPASAGRSWWPSTWPTTTRTRGRSPCARARATRPA